eukprot:507742-Pelagomonas_calceolata.AAC.14
MCQSCNNKALPAHSVLDESTFWATCRSVAAMGESAQNNNRANDATNIASHFWHTRRGERGADPGSPPRPLLQPEGQMNEALLMLTHIFWFIFYKAKRNAPTD